MEKEMEKEQNIIYIDFEYLKWKRWNGRQYNHKGIIEFEIKNGKGYGKEYDYDWILKFEGEYLNRIRWNGKGYNKNDEMEFEIKNGKEKGEDYDNNDSEFKREYSNEKENVKKSIFDNDSIQVFPKRLSFSGLFLDK